METGHVTTVLPSDWGRYGRLPAIVLSNSVCLVAGVVTPLLPGLAPFLVLRFIMGLAFNTFYTVPYILGEYTEHARVTHSAISDYSSGVRLH